MTVIVMLGSAATEPAHHEARQALRSRGEVRTSDAHRGRADIIVAELPPGARTVPPDVAAAAREASATGILLWATEPMVRPVAPVGAGQVVLASPTHRGHTISALDILLGAPELGRGDQALQRHWWCAWVAGGERPRFDVSQSEALGATFVHLRGEARAAAPGRTAAQILAHAQTDARRCSLLRDGLGADVHAVHLAPGGGYWLVHWPTHATPLWLYSALRMPARWSLSATLATTGTPFVRIPAFAGDVMIAAEIADEATAELTACLPQGALEAHRALERLVQRPADWGVVLEVR
jgi:hypothetical protein